MKKLVVLIGATCGVLGAVMVKQTQKAQAEADLWAEATDPVGASDH